MEKSVRNLEINESKDDGSYQPITCYICIDLYSMQKKPLILVCGHTFCEVCLQNLFDTSNEIQCCFCKVITKLDRFEDMIVNYAILSLAEQGGVMTQKVNQKEANKNGNVSLRNMCSCENLQKNPDRVEKLLQCIDCNTIVCPNCIIAKNTNDNLNNENGKEDPRAGLIHKNHKLTNLVDYIHSESHSLSDHLKNYRELANKFSGIHKKVDKFEIEKIIKQEKEGINSFFKELKSHIDKNQELMLHTLDKLMKDSYKVIDNFKKEMKYFNTDSTRYCSIVEELCHFKSISNKQKVKLLNIYNVNSTFDEIKEFNKEVNMKSSKLITSDIFMKNLLKLIKNCELYKKKMIKFHDLINKKETSMLEKGFESKIKFYSRKTK